MFPWRPIVLIMLLAVIGWRIARAVYRGRVARARARSAALAAIDRELAAGADAAALIEAELTKARQLHARGRATAGRVVAGFSIVTAVAELGTALDRYRRSDDRAADLLAARELATRAMAIAMDAETQYAARMGRTVQFVGTWWLSGGFD